MLAVRHGLAQPRIGGHGEVSRRVKVVFTSSGARFWAKRVLENRISGEFQCEIKRCVGDLCDSRDFDDNETENDGGGWEIF